jgi:hypothetical protein
MKPILSAVGATPCHLLLRPWSYARSTTAIRGPVPQGVQPLPRPRRRCENVGNLTASTVTIAVNPNFPRPLLYAAISSSYNIVGSLIVSAIVLAI